MHSNAERQLVEHAFPLLEAGMRVLEAGPDDEDIVRRHIEAAGCEYEWYDHRIEPAGREYDAVVSSNVFEHVARPWEFIAYQAGLLRSGGLLVCGCPNSWRYHQSVTDDYFRAYPAGLRVLMEDAGLEVIVEVRDADDDSEDTLVIGRKP